MIRSLICLILTLLCGCSAQLAGGALSEKQQLLQEILTAPTAVCAAVIQQDAASLSAIKQSLTQPAPPPIR